MIVKILMPKGSDTMTEGKVLSWFKKEGEQISTGETVVEIETNKVNMEVEATGSGVLRKILVAVGNVVPVGELLAVVAKPDEDIAALLRGNGAAGAVSPGTSGGHPATQAVAPLALPTPAPAPAAGKTSAPKTQAPPTPSVLERESQDDGRVLASPLARRMAREKGLDLKRIAGSGPAGRISRQDVERVVALGIEPAGGHVAGAAGAEAAKTAPSPALPRRRSMVSTGPEFCDEPLNSMRKVIATRLVQSKGPVPHFYLTNEVDMARAKELRESANVLNSDVEFSYNDIILKACAVALALHPEVNASFQDESIRYHRRIHLGVAVAIEGGGLVTPVIRNCHEKNLHDIAREGRDLVARARSRKLNPDEYTGATFTVSISG